MSAIAAALLSTHPVPSKARETESINTLPSSYDGQPLTALPAALTSGRLLPLTHPTSVTRWAPVLRTTAARRRPTRMAATVGMVPARTPEHTTNLVVADGERVIRGAIWVRVTLAVLPNDTRGWVPRTSLGGWSFVDTHLVIDRARLTATLFRGGRAIFHAPVGIGSQVNPTPAGTFYVRDRLNGFKSPFYGPLAFGLNARSPTVTDWPAGGFVGIHGTDEPVLIPGRVSHGCIRLTNDAILRLGRLMPVGTPVTIT